MNSTKYFCKDFPLYKEKDRYMHWLHITVFYIYSVYHSDFV